MLKCYHCGSESVSWIADVSFEDVGYEGEGIIQMYHCNNCNIDIECKIKLSDDDIKEVVNGKYRS